MNVGDHAPQAALGRRGQKVGPKGLGVRAADRHAQDRAPTITVDVDDDGEGNRDYASIRASDVGSVAVAVIVFAPCSFTLVVQCDTTFCTARGTINQVMGGWQGGREGEVAGRNDAMIEPLRSSSPLPEASSRGHVPLPV